MSVVSDATMRAGAEIASGPDVWFVLVQYGPCKDLWRKKKELETTGK